MIKNPPFKFFFPWLTFLHLGDFRVVEHVQCSSDQPAQIGIGMTHHEPELMIYLGVEKFAGISSLTILLWSLDQEPSSNSPLVEFTALPEKNSSDQQDWEKKPSAVHWLISKGSICTCWHIREWSWCFHCVSAICTSKCEGRWLKLRGLTIKNDRWIVCHISLHALSALRPLKLPASGYRSACVLAAYISMTYPTQ